jgi:hypothetical protein
MKIYTGWTIKALTDSAKHLQGARIAGSGKIRSTQFYYLTMPDGQTRSIKRSELLAGVSDKAIWFDN